VATAYSPQRLRFGADHTRGRQANAAAQPAGLPVAGHLGDPPLPPVLWIDGVAEKHVAGAEWLAAEQAQGAFRFQPAEQTPAGAE